MKEKSGCGSALTGKGKPPLGKIHVPEGQEVPSTPKTDTEKVPFPNPLTLGEERYFRLFPVKNATLEITADQYTVGRLPYWRGCKRKGGRSLRRKNK